MSPTFEASKSLTGLDQDSTLIVVVEVSQSSWLVAAMVPGISRQPLKKLDPDEETLLKLVHRWRDEAASAGRDVTRIVLAYEAGRDGFWLARWLRARGIEAHVIHPSSVAVSREHRRAKTDRLDTQLLMRAFLGWLRGELRHCTMAAIPTVEEEDARRPSREREKLVSERTRIVNRLKATLARFGIRGFKPTLRNAAERLDELRTAERTALPENTRAEAKRAMARLAVIRDQIKEIEQERSRKLRTTSPMGERPNLMVTLLARIIGISVETADMLVTEILSRPLRDRKAVAVMADLPAHRTRAAAAAARKVSPERATRGCDAP
jgi:transposase